MKFSAILVLAVLDVVLGAPLALSPESSLKERATDVIQNNLKREPVEGGVVTFQGEYNDIKKKREPVEGGVVTFQGEYNDIKKKREPVEGGVVTFQGEYNDI